MADSTYTPEERREQTIRELALTAKSRVSEDLDEIFHKRVTEAVGHSDWPGDVDPLTSVRFDDALLDVLVTLIGNGIPEVEDVPSAFAAYLGKRARLKRNVERFPHFIAPEGALGTVSEVTDDLVAVKLDDHLPGCEEWDNEVVWSDADFSHLADDIEVID